MKRHVSSPKQRDGRSGGPVVVFLSTSSSMLTGSPPIPPARSIRSGAHAARLVVAFTCLALASPTPASGQSAIDSRIVEFIPSSDHWATLPDGSAIVALYRLELYVIGASKPYQMVDLGKPRPDADGRIRMGLMASLRASPPARTNYAARVVAVGPTGRGESNWSDVLSFTDPCDTETTGGLDETIRTAACSATATTSGAAPIHSTGARLNGLVNPNGAPTTVRFQYGLTASYGSVSRSLNLPPLNSFESVASLVSGLACDTTYHYRVVAETVGEATVGADAIFTSAACASSTGTLIWREKLTGQNLVWLMNGSKIAAAAFLATVADPQWTIEATGDIDGDHQPDLMWHNAATGENVVWFLTGTTGNGSIPLPPVADPDWQIKGLRDFDGDGKADLIWHNRATGENEIWFLNETGVLNWSTAPTVADLDWEIAGVSDFDGDGKADLLWRHTRTGEIAVWLMDGATLDGVGFLPQVTDVTWTIAGVIDLDGDGRGDILWRNAAAGLNLAWFMSGTTPIASGFLPGVADPAWTILRLADLDDDGAGDLVWRNRATEQIGLWLMNGAAIQSAESFTLMGAQNWELIDR
jgi:hypothetical protein